MKVRGMCVGGSHDGQMVEGWKDRVLCLAVPLYPVPVPMRLIERAPDSVTTTREYYRPIEFFSNGHTVWFFATDGMDGHDVLLQLIKHYRPPTTPAENR